MIHVYVGIIAVHFKKYSYGNTKDDIFLHYKLFGNATAYTMHTCKCSLSKYGHGIFWLQFMMHDHVTVSLK